MSKNRSNESFYEMMLDEKERYLDKICMKSIGKNLIIYGAGVIAEELYWTLKERRKKVFAFCVTYTEKNRNSIDGVPVIKFDVTDKQFVNNAYIVIATKKSNDADIIKRLVEAGITNFEKPLDSMINLFGMGLQRMKCPNLEITTKIGCKINCKYCPQALLIDKYTKDTKRDIYLSFDTFKWCINKIPRNTIITFSGYCEPFLNNKCIDMIQYAIQMGHRVTLNSTLVGLSMEDARVLATLPIELMILHTPDEKEYANIPITDEYKEVLNFLLDIKLKDGRPFVKTANCQSTPKKEIVELINGRVTFSDEHLQDIAGNIIDKEVAENINLSGEIVCSQSIDLNRNVLLPDGSIVLCCLDYALKHVLGNILVDSYEKIMSGKEMACVKSKMKNGEEVLCRHCISAKQYSE